MLTIRWVFTVDGIYPAKHEPTDSSQKLYSPHHTRLSLSLLRDGEDHRVVLAEKVSRAQL